MPDLCRERSSLPPALAPPRVRERIVSFGRDMETAAMRHLLSKCVCDRTYVRLDTVDGRRQCDLYRPKDGPRQRTGAVRGPGRWIGGADKRRERDEASTIFRHAVRSVTKKLGNKSERPET